MRLLVFCGSRQAIDAYADLPGWTVAISPSVAAFPDMIDNFKKDPQAKLAVLGPQFAIGWRVPEGTLVLFDPSWRYGPSSPEWIQAAARVRRLDTSSSGLRYDSGLDDAGYL